MTEPTLIATDQLLNDLDQFIGLPSSSGQVDDLATVASRLGARMRAYGLQIETSAAAGAPVIIGSRAGRSPFTLLLYHHYDTAPVGPWREWHHDPFQLAEREGMLYGRGIADGKGPLIAHLNAIAALLKSEGELPCGVVVVVEGEALLGSPSLGDVVAQSQALLQANACLATGGEHDSAGISFCYSGAKGLLQVQLRASNARLMLPSGLAASVQNPLWRLLWAIGQIKSDQEEVLIGGFYDDVEGPSRAENQSLRNVTLDEAGRKEAWGIGGFLFGMEGTALVRTETTLPTCNIAALTVDPASDLPTIPTAASARLDFQLVPQQQPQTITELLREHLQNKGMDDITVEQLPGSYPATHTPYEHPFIQLISETGRQIYNVPLPLLPQGAFAQPLAFFAQTFGIPVASVGCARLDSAVCAPNEHIPLTDLLQHGQLLIEILYACAHNPPS